jgi:hypothetical protein
LKNPFRSGSLKWKGLSIGTTLIALSAVVLAWNVTWNAPISLIVDSIDLKVYWEQNCTTPVTTIDFGKIYQTSQEYNAWMFIKNEGLGTVAIRWNSTLHFVTDKIGDWWLRMDNSGINGTTIAHNQVLQVRYRIYVYQNVVPGSYSWTLYLGAEQ